MERISLVDYPGLICTTLFTGGCNFDCPWCYNQDLIHSHSYDKLPDIEIIDVQEFLLRKKAKVQAVTVTGGEPSLVWDKLIPFFQWCREQGLKCKIDTNGYRPDVVEKIINSKLIDFIAMDVKNTWEKYPQAAGVADMDVSLIQQSIKLIQDSNIPHQFRCTMVHKWVVAEEIDGLEKELGEPIVRQDYLYI